MGKLKQVLIDIENEQVYLSLDEPLSDLKVDVLKGVNDGE